MSAAPPRGGCDVPLPRGIWYEAARKRYRVRLYRNKIPYLYGYYDELPDAEAALAQLRGKLRTIRKVRHTHAQAVPCSTFRGLAASVRQDQQLDPRPYKGRLQ